MCNHICNHICNHTSVTTFPGRPRLAEPLSPLGMGGLGEPEACQEPEGCQELLQQLEATSTDELLQLLG